MKMVARDFIICRCSSSGPKNPSPVFKKLEDLEFSNSTGYTGINNKIQKHLFPSRKMLVTGPSLEFDAIFCRSFIIIMIFLLFFPL